MIDAMYEAPSGTRKTFDVTADYVREKLEKSHFELNKDAVKEA